MEHESDRSKTSVRNQFADSLHGRHPTDANLRALKEYLEAGAPFRRTDTRVDVNDMVFNIMHDQAPKIPQMSEPGYRYFREEYNRHLSIAREYWLSSPDDIRQQCIDTNTLTKVLREQMKPEADKAADILETFRITHLNVKVAYLQALQRAFNRKKRFHDEWYNRGNIGQDWIGVMRRFVLNV